MERQWTSSWAPQCTETAYPYPDCRHPSTKSMWHTFIHSHWTVLGFAIALVVVLSVIAAVLLRRSIRRRRQRRNRTAGKIADTPPEQNSGVELAGGTTHEAENRREGAGERRTEE